MTHFRNLSLITAVSRVSGLLREIAKAYFLGVGVANDAFTLAFAIPNLFRRLTAEGATLNAFVPSLSEVARKEGREGLRRFFSGFFAWYALGLTAICAAFALSADFWVSSVFAPGFGGEGVAMAVELMRIMFFYLLFVSLSALAQGVLNYHDRYRLSASAPILLNLSVIGFAWVFSSFFENPVYGFAIGVIAGGAMQLGVQLWGLRGVLRFSFGTGTLVHPQILKTLGYVVPGIFGAGIYQINIIVGNAIASTLGVGAISALNFSNRLLEFALGVFVVSITTVLLPRLSKLAEEKRLDEIGRNISDALLLTGFLTIPATIALAVYAKEIMLLLFGYGSFDDAAAEMCAQALFAHSFGLFFIGGNRVLTTALQSAKFFRAVVEVAFAAMLVNLLACFGLSLFLGHVGIAYANSASQLFQFCAMIFVVRKKLGVRVANAKNLAGFSLQALSALPVLVLFLLFSQTEFFREASVHLKTPAILALSGCVYLLSAKIFRVGELELILKTIFRRKKA